MQPTHKEHVVEQHIERTPGVRSGKPRIRGTRATVADVVLWTEPGWSVGQVTAEFPQLGLADVYAALAYYYDNQAIIDNQIRDSRESADNMKAKLEAVAPSSRSDAHGNSLSS